MVNISLGYNFVAGNLLGDASPDDVPGLKLHVMHQANLIRLMASRVKDYVLFVVAAGNDSEGRDTPISARWASPFAWAGTQESAAGERPENILVVEAIDRDGMRAAFLEHRRACGSTRRRHHEHARCRARCVRCVQRNLAGGTHVAALAALLFELDPTKKPGEVAQIIKTTSQAPKAGSKAAPSIDALESIAAVNATAVAAVADLDTNGRVDDADLRIFARAEGLIEAAATKNALFTEDLNGDGSIDDNECFYPRIDFNGSGQGTIRPADAMPLGGAKKSDLAIFEMAWSDPAKPFEAAVKEAGLTPRADIYATATAPQGAVTQCRRLVSTTTTADATETSGSSERGLVIAAADGNGNPALVSNPADVKAEVETAIQDLRKTHPKLRVIINPATGCRSPSRALRRSRVQPRLGLRAGLARSRKKKRSGRWTRFSGRVGFRRSIPPRTNRRGPNMWGDARIPISPIATSRRGAAGGGRAGVRLDREAYGTALAWRHQVYGHDVERRHRGYEGQDLRERGDRDGQAQAAGGAAFVSRCIACVPARRRSDEGRGKGAAVARVRSGPCRQSQGEGANAAGLDGDHRQLPHFRRREDWRALLLLSRSADRHAAQDLGSWTADGVPGLHGCR